MNALKSITSVFSTQRCSRGSRWALRTILVVMLGAGVTRTPAAAVTHLQYAQQAPAVTLTDLEGNQVSTAQLNGQVVILVLGEVYHSRTRRACAQIEDVLQGGSLGDQQVTTLLIVSQDVSAKQLKAEAVEYDLSTTILHDADRQVFENYQVAVLPSIVILDTEGRVAHTIAGLTNRFTDVLSDALLLAAGRIDQVQFTERLHPKDVDLPSEQDVRAGRLTQLAGQLAQRGLLPLAEQKYEEAIELSGDHIPAQLGMGMLQLRRHRLPVAEKHFRMVIEREPDNWAATLGLAFVQTLRGGAELSLAQQAVQRVIASQPSHARAHYLLGMIQDKQDKIDKAAASFRKAAELLFEQSETGMYQ